MHAEYLKLLVANCRQRIAEGDHPTVTGHSPETLEEAVVALADQLAAGPAAALAEALRELLAAAEGPQPYAGRTMSLSLALGRARDVLREYDAPPGAEG